MASTLHRRGQWHHALLIALMALGVQAGDEVITTPSRSFPHQKRSPCWVRRLCMWILILSPTTLIRKLEAVISTRTKAIIPVSFMANQLISPPLMRLPIASLAVIEDGAQSFGSEQQGRQLVA